MGSGKPKKVKAPTITSQYEGTNKSTFNSDFGSGSSFFETGTDPVTGNATKQIVTNSTLNPALQGVANTATSGLQNNLSYLSMDPSQRVGFLTSGQDPLYNVLTDQNNKAFEQNIGRANINAARNGNTNSTALGGTLGQLMANDQVTKNQILLNALQYGNQTANTNAATNLGALGGLAQLVYPLGSAANSSFQSALNQLDSIAAQNAQMKLQAEMANAAAQNTQRSPWGSIAGSLLGIAGSALPLFGANKALSSIGGMLSSAGNGLGSLSPSAGNSNIMPFASNGYTSQSYSNPLSSYAFSNPLNSSGLSSLSYTPSANYFLNPNNYALSVS